MKTVMWDCPYCNTSVPLAVCITHVYDEEFDGDVIRLFRLECPYCEGEDCISYPVEVKE